MRRSLLSGGFVFLWAGTTPNAPAASLDVRVAASADDAEESATGGVTLNSTDLELVLDKNVQTVGLRFVGVGIPRGAQVTTAYVQFEVDEATTAAASLTLQGQAADNPGTFQKTSKNISLRLRTAASVAWSPAPWPTVQLAGPDQRTPNISAVIQEIVSRAGWASGNAIVIVVTGSGRRTAEAWDGTRAPLLHIEYQTLPPPNQQPSVSAGPDQQVLLPATVSLSGAVTDDGLPMPPQLTQQWSQVSGPGPVSFANASALSTTATLPSPGVYVVRLTASDSALTAFDDVTLTAVLPDTNPPSAPTALAATAPSVHRVDLSWMASTDDVGVTGYSIYRDGLVIGTSATTAFSDTGVAAETLYSYTVTARDAAGNISPASEPASVTTPTPTSIFFAAAGDHGAAPRTDASLAALDRSGAEFYLALGDLDYDETPTDEAWCDYVKARLPTLGPDFPFQLVSGNHEEQGGSNGYILNHAACLPDRLNSTLGLTNQYAAEYFFDYPASAPLVRVVMIAASLMIENVAYDYLKGDAHYAWLAGTIDSARAAGIPWVVVGMHELCYSAGLHSYSISSDLHNLLVEKKVDLVLQGHDHNYQRGRQLALTAACPKLLAGSFNANCVVDSGADNAYVKGAGTVFVVDGSFGRPLYAINSSDPEFGYFARTDSSSWGFMTYAVNADRIDARFVASAGSLGDAFSIVSPGINTPPVANAGPDQQVTLPNAAALAGAVDDDGLPSPSQLTHHWSQVSGPGTVSFADAGSPATSATFPVTGTYVLRLSASDSALSATDDVTVTVLAPNVPYTLEVRVAASTDDAEEAVTTGSVSRSSSDLELTTDITTEQVVGLRFAPLSLPKGATILKAYVQFETDEKSIDPAALTVAAQAADNATTFLGASFNISSRPRTATSVAWTPAPWPTLQIAGPDQRTPDLSGVIQEVVARPGWATGNAIVIIVSGTGRRTAEAFDGTSAPTLHIEYNVN